MKVTGGGEGRSGLGKANGDNKVANWTAVGRT